MLPTIAGDMPSGLRTFTGNGRNRSSVSPSSVRERQEVDVDQRPHARAGELAQPPHGGADAQHAEETFGIP
jgi:hypothetical protein